LLHWRLTLLVLLVLLMLLMLVLRQQRGEVVVAVAVATG
jgi:hypothetical protein